MSQWNFTISVVIGVVVLLSGFMIYQGLYEDVPESDLCILSIEASQSLNTTLTNHCEPRSIVAESTADLYDALLFCKKRWFQRLPEPPSELYCDICSFIEHQGGVPGPFGLMNFEPGEYTTIFLYTDSVGNAQFLNFLSSFDSALFLKTPSEEGLFISQQDKLLGIDPPQEERLFSTFASQDNAWIATIALLPHDAPALAQIGCTARYDSIDI